MKIPSLLLVPIALTSVLQDDAKATTLKIFQDKAAFLGATGAVNVTGPLPNLGGVANSLNLTGSATVGAITFSLAPGGDNFFIGSAPDPDIYPQTPGNDIAFGYENLQVQAHSPILALGFEIVEPSNDPITGTMPEGGGTAVPSTYQVTLFNGPTQIGQANFTIPTPDVVAFVGVQSDTAFDKAWIIDVTQSSDGTPSPFIADDELFGEFYFATTAPAIPFDLKTELQGMDSDGDGLPDKWESFGVDVDGDGQIGQNDLNLPALGANPLRKDIFLQIDYMDCIQFGGDCPQNPDFLLTHNHRPKPAAIDLVVESFANAPVSNPNGSTGINLHVDVRNSIPHQSYLNFPDKCEGLNDPRTANFDKVKEQYFGTNNPRRFAYHYMVFGHRKHPNGAGMSSGCAEKPGNDVLVTLGDWHTLCIGPGKNGKLDTTLRGDDIIVTFNGGNSDIFTGFNLACDSTIQGDDVAFTLVSDEDRDGLIDMSVGTVLEQAGTIMHELGHNLDLGHGGGDEENYKPNYLSIMNYSFQAQGLRRIAIQPSVYIDYSRSNLPTLAETVLLDFDGLHFIRRNGLNENLSISGGGNIFTKYTCPLIGGNRRERSALAFRPIDWNCDGDTSDTGLTANINGFEDRSSNFFSLLKGYDDWNNLRFNFQTTPDFADGIHIAGGPLQEELDYLSKLNIAAPVIVDIKPSDLRNTINPGKSGLIPVAILTDKYFDATLVDPLSVRFGTNEAQEAHGRGHIEDADGDGDLDMILHFANQATGIACGQTSASLTGNLKGGQAITGFNEISTVGCKQSYATTAP